MALKAETFSDTNNFVKKYTGLRLIGQESKKTFVFEYRADPGTVVTGEFKAVHDFQDENEPRTFYLYASDFVVDTKTGNVSYPGRTFTTEGKFSLAKYITFNKDNFTLDRWGDEEIIEFTINLPEEIDPGTYYAALVVSSISKEDYITGNVGQLGPAAAAITTRLAPVVFMTVNGDLRAEVDASLEILTSNEGEPFLGVHEYLPVLIKTQLNNNGNYYINPAGNIFIHRGDVTDPVKTFRFNENGNRLLPESARPFYNIWDESLFLYKPINNPIINGYVTFTPDKSRSLRLGRYYATAKIAYKDADDKLEVITLEKVFWVVPWKLLFVLGVVLIVFGYIGLKKLIDLRLR